MKRKRDSSAAAAAAQSSFSVRWHSIANPATPSVDIMSSPDPLNDDDTMIVPPSSRRVTRSLRSDRFASRATSPRKQTFELEVGDNVSPQRLLVTVETEDGNPPASNTRRRLFPGSSSSPFQASRPRPGMATTTTTTTTVPLRESIEEEPGHAALDAAATPRRRGRPRKTNGTPMPSAAKKRKAGTPLKQRTPRRQSTVNELDPLSDPVVQPTPTPRKRGRPPKASTVEPSSDAGLESASKTVSARRGRRRRQALIPEELVEMAEEAADDEAPALPDVAPSENDVDLVAPPSDAPVDEPPPQAHTATAPETRPAPADPGSDFDLWMDEAPPRPTAPAQPRSEPSAVDPEDQRRSPSADYESIASFNNDFGGAPSPSPSPSAHSDAGTSSKAGGSSRVPGRDNGDTIAHGEDFSMIFMESIQSFQDFKSSVPGPRQPLPLPDSDIDEEASLIINKTLASLRQSVRQDDEAEANDVTLLANQELAPQQQYPEAEGQTEDAAEEQTETEQANAIPETSHQSPWQNTSPRIYTSSPAVPRDQPDGLASDETTPIFSPVVVSSPNRMLSPRWATRGLRRPNISPLRQRLLKSQVRQLDDAPTVPAADVEKAASEVSPSPQASPSVRQHEDEYEDSFSEIPQNVLEAATPRRPAFAAPVSSPDVDEQPAPMEDDRIEESDPQQVSEEVELENQLSEDVELENQLSEEAELVGAAFAAVERNSEPAEEPAEDIATAGEPEVLDESDDDLWNPQRSDEPEPQSLHASSHASHRQPAAPSNASSAAQTDRLPTPDDTPPNLQVAEGEDQEKPAEQTMHSSPLVPQLQVENQPVSSSPASSPPAQHTNSAERPAVSIEITPVNLLSSPVNEPQSAAAESPMERTVRPTLSAIVRAGRALQTITSDPPSPEPKEHQLGSPFRSSVSKESWSGSRESATGKRSAIISPSRRSIGHRRQTASIDQLQDDPFVSTSRNTGQSSFMQALGWSVSRQQSPDKPRMQPLGSANSSMRATPPDEEMSWVANEGPISPRLRGDNSLREAAGLPATVADEHQQPPSDDNEDEEAMEDAGLGDETDIWEVEAERSLLEPAPEQPAADAFAASHRRGTIPSPWMRQSTRSRQQVANQPVVDSGDNMVGTTAQVGSQPGEDVDEMDDEYSLLTQRQAVAEEAAAPASAAKGGRVDLSSFFSSPAAIPGMLVNKLFPSRAPNASEREQTLPPAIATTSMFPQVASNPFRPQSEAPADIVSPSKSSQPPSSRVRSSSAPVAQEDSSRQQDAPSRRDLSSPFVSSSRVSAAPRRASADLERGSPATSEHIEMPVVAQKQNFTPRPRQPSQSFFQPSSSAPTPPRMQLSHADIQRWQQETSNASESSPDLGRRSLLLRPLPPRNASPTKSSLRSPMKPHTPGRVVEFTSSVLSPVEQARARQERRSSNASSLAPAATTQNQPTNQPAPAAATVVQEDQSSDVSMSDASPLPAQRHAPLMSSTEPAAAAPREPSSSSSSTWSSKKLSQTVWTRQHWLFLDRILERRLVGDFDVDFPRRADRYLGKKVKSHGEAMVLERWHLDCVDAFRAVVGGWDEGDLAKRLFSLIRAEEKRRGVRGHAAARPSRVMFH